MVAGQKINAGMIQAGKTATVTCENNHFRVVVDGEPPPSSSAPPHVRSTDKKPTPPSPNAVAPCPE